MAEILAFVSGKGGVGTTTVAAFEAAALAKQAHRVLLLDLNVGYSSIEYVFGVQGKTVYNIVDVVEGNCKIIQALIPIKEYRELFLISGSKSRDLSGVSMNQFTKLIQVFTQHFEYIVIDVPAKNKQALSYAASVADRVIMVSTIDDVSVALTNRTIALLPVEKRRDTYLVLNRIRLDLVKSEETGTPEMACQKIDIPLLGMIPECDDIYLQKETNDDILDARRGPTREFYHISMRLQGEDVPFSLK